MVHPWNERFCLERVLPVAETPQYLPPEVAQRIVNALATRGLIKQCNFCQVGRFSIVDGFISPRLSRSIAEAANLFGEYTFLPCVGLVCQHCGNLVLLTLERLGLSDLLPKAQSEQKNQGGPNG